MKVGISSYCYHRYFGEIYDGLQTNPSRKMTIDNFIERARQLNVDGISLEEKYLPSHDIVYLKELKAKLDAYSMDRVYSWGYPVGLEGGKNEKAYDDMIRHIDYANAMGAGVMRVIGSSDMTKDVPRDQQVERLSVLFSQAAKIAERRNVRLAQANHSDFSPEQLLQIAQNVNSPHFGLNFVTGNFFRVHSDPVEGMEKLAKYTFGVNVKDLKPQRYEPLSSWHFFASTPVGDGLVDNMKLARILEQAGYKGFMAVEIDYLHPDYHIDEDEAVARSVRYLESLVREIK